MSLTAEMLAEEIKRLGHCAPLSSELIACDLLPFIERHIAAGQQGDDIERIAAECGAVIGYTGPGGELGEAAFSRKGLHQFARCLATPRPAGGTIRCIWPDCGHDTNCTGYSPGCTGIGCPKPESAKPAGAVPLPLVDASFEAFNEITGLCSNLREGGPVPEDLEGLSSGLESAIDIAANMLAKISDSRSAPIPQQPEAEGDDIAVDRFAEAMKAKMAAARAKGRGGWEGPTCNAEILSRMLRDHVEKGDPRDVANFCMMLWNRGEAIQASPAADAGGVTDEMTKRLRKILRDRWGINFGKESARAALLAALAPEVNHGE